jgi:hypothetical protein
MAEVASMDLAVLSHCTTRLVATADAGHEDFLNVRNLANLGYLQDRNMVSLPESLGAREVASKQVPAGPSSPG